jgi:hypothetical protein
MTCAKIGSTTIAVLKRGLSLQPSLVIAGLLVGALILLSGCGGGGGGGGGDEGNGGGGSTDNGNTENSAPSSPQPPCNRHYKVVDAQGNPQYTYAVNEDGDRIRKPLTIVGAEHSNIYDTPDEVQRVEDLGGQMVAEIDNGQSTRRFNCVGWVFRELNCRGGSCDDAEYGGYGWNPNLQLVYQDFTRSGLLRKVEGSIFDPYQVGDKCFFFYPDDEDHTIAKHVAEIVYVGYTKAGTTVRAPDGWTGVFDADLGAAWFDEKKYSDDVDCYRWADGVEMPLKGIPDPVAAANDPRSCSDTDDKGGAEPNTPPTCNDGSVTVAPGQSVAIEFSAADDDDDDLTYSISNGPTRGTFNSATSTYTPDGLYSGTDSLTFVANDGNADSEVCMIDITITGCPLIEGVCTTREQSAGLTLTYWLQSPPPWGGAPIAYCTDSSGDLLTPVVGGLTTAEVTRARDWNENWNGWWDSQVLTCGRDDPAGGILVCAEGVSCDQECETIEGTCTVSEQSAGLTLTYLLVAQPPYTGPPIPYCEDGEGTLFVPTPYGLRNAEVVARGDWDAGRNGWWDSQVLTCGYDAPAGGILVIVP